LFTAIRYLETQKKVHRDISYTNILLRERDQTNVGRAAREKVMEELGLSEIEKLRERLDCREGLLIDFDYGAALIGEQTTREGTNSGEKQKEGASNSKEKQREVNINPVSGARTVS
jgi:serine/threonine protein kinase